MGALYVIWMVVVGLVLTPLTLAVGRSPPFFTSAYFLAVDWLNIIVFALLMYAAIHNRTRTDWHRRLMLCATICVIAPAWGRLIALSGNQITTFNIVGMLLLYVVVAMIADWYIRGRVHPAYFWGAGTLIGMGLCVEMLAVFPPFIALANRIVG
jgi:hypothetical protein